MFGAKDDLAEEHAELCTKYDVVRRQLAEKTAECETWKASSKAGGRIAGDLIIRTRQLQDAQQQLRATEDDLGKARQRLAILTANRVTAWQIAGIRAQRQLAEAPRVLAPAVTP